MTDFDNDFQDFIDELGSKEQPVYEINLKTDGTEE